MRSTIGLLAIPLLTLTVHAAPPALDPAALSERAMLLAPIQVDSLTLTPIVATAGTGAPSAELDVLVLDEAFAAKQVKIREQEHESVNSLTLTNQANRPLFLLAGEVIIGGKQDRIIGANTVIPARTTQDVPVFCVEHGRWDKGKDFTTAKALAHGRLRGQANFAAQQDVWNEVSAKNAARKTANDTDTYRKVATQQSDGTLARSEKRVDAALARLPAADRARMIGYVVALNGKVATVDMFQSPRLFTKLSGKLVRSYLTEAIDVAAAKNIVAPTAGDVKAFIADADKARAEAAYENAASDTKVYKGAKAAKSRVMLKPTAGGGVAPAPLVYETYQAQ